MVQHVILGSTRFVHVPAHLVVDRTKNSSGHGLVFVCHLDGCYISNHRPSYEKFDIST